LNDAKAALSFSGNGGKGRRAQRMRGFRPLDGLVAFSRDGAQRAKFLTAVTEEDFLAILARL
jgi:hypothetical protein